MIKMNKKVLALAGGLTLLGSLVLVGTAANASDAEARIAEPVSGSYVVPEQEVFEVLTAGEIEGFATCMNSEGFDTSVSEDNGGIVASVADSLKSGYDTAVNACGLESFGDK